jgi:hypothetical protein
MINIDIFIVFFKLFLQFINNWAVLSNISQNIREIFLYLFGNPALTEIFIKPYIPPLQIFLNFFYGLILS